jgi:hypothetical protein
MHIATEIHTGAKLHGSFSEEGIAAFAMSFRTAEFVEQHGEPQIDLSAEAMAIRARRLCADHITTHYPDWKQLNILRAGTKAQKDQMTAFIDACRDWSNGDKPNPADLATIAP